MASSYSSTANIKANTSVFSSLTINDLITGQLERINLAELSFKDELQLQLQLVSQSQLHSQKQRIQRQPASSHETELNFFETKNINNPKEASSLEDVTHFSKRNSIDDEFVGAVGGVNSTIRKETTVNSGDLHKEFRSQVVKWFQQLKDRTSYFKSDEESRRVREAGNDIYRRERHSLKACDFFTEAIFLSPSKNSIAAAMAHANRSTVLYDCEMYSQSYDDCLCALDLGYPEEYFPLIKLRQASCALKLRNYSLCEEHLHELLHMELTEAFEARTHELWHQCEIFKAERFEMGVQTDDDLTNNDVKVYEVAWLDNSNVMTTNRGAYMRATKNITKNSMIFQEDAAVIVPNGSSRICDNCGITQFVPFPCIYCCNRTAIYCSRQCRIKHAAIHAVECFAHQIELFEEFGEVFSKPRILQLAFRMLITGLPQVVLHCRKKPTLQKLWCAFNGVLTERNDIEYSTILRLETHIDRQNIETLVSLAIAAHILAIYLNKYTGFFEQLERIMPSSSKLSNSEWEILTASLILRHICQLRHKNLTHCLSFVLPADPHVFSALNEFQLWTGYLRAHRGHLHLIAGDIATIAYAVYPQTLSLCRQSCSSTIYSKFSGRQLIAYAQADVPAGATIYNCFSNIGNYRQSSYDDRQLDMKSRGIECKCEACLRPQPDEDFHKFHRYRCDNPNCMQVFTPPNLKDIRNLRWWKSEFYIKPENNGCELLACIHCGETQKMEWFWAFHSAILNCDSIEERCKLYAAIERAESQLVEMHECKVALARQLVEQCLLVNREGATTLDDWEFNKLGSIMRSALHVVAAQYSIHGIEYVQHFAYFWDVMALSNYKCSDKELIQMLNGLEYISDEFKTVFINYYEDYIAPKFTEETYATIVDTQV